MKIVKLFAGFLLVILTSLLIMTFPYKFVRGSVRELFFLLSALGGVTYLLIHLLRKPEGIYIWNHELSHLFMAKIFFRKVSGFHITEKKGGKVVIDRSNCFIDLAPYYFFPFILFFTALALLFEMANFKEIVPFYYFLFGFLFSMMGVFTADSFLKRQDDIVKNGFLFSFALILFFITLSVSLYLLPGTEGKIAFLKGLSHRWIHNVKREYGFFLHALRESRVWEWGGSFIRRFSQ